MERDANYLAVGAFTLLVLAMAVFFVLWYADSGDDRDYMPYELYFTGSVSGLTVGSPVRYLGVDVGSVRRISVDKARPNSVKVVASVDAGAPISGATRASLGLQGITGLLYINLKQVPNVEDGALKQGERYPVIESQSSDIDAFIATLPQLAARVSQLVDSVNQVFSPQNVENVGRIVADLRTTTGELPATQQKLQTLLADLSSTSAEIKSLATSFDGLATDVRPEIRAAMTQLNTVSARLATSSQRLDEFLAKSEAPLNHFTQQGLFEMERTLRDARNAAMEFRELSRSLKETPSQLMFEKPETGMEIKP